MTRRPRRVLELINQPCSKFWRLDKDKHAAGIIGHRLRTDAAAGVELPALRPTSSTDAARRGYPTAKLLRHLFCRPVVIFQGLDRLLQGARPVRN